MAVVSKNGHDTGQELEAVISGIGHEKAVAVLMLTGRYVMHALIANCLNLAPPGQKTPPKLGFVCTAIYANFTRFGDVHIA